MPISRRQFVIASTFTAGFALAVQPIVNSAIQTSSKNLVSGSISIPSSTGAIPAYYAAPAKGEGFPVVLVIQEIFGVHEHIRDVVRRFARLGYVAIAPELFARQGDVSKLKDVNEIRKIVAKVPDLQVLTDIDASLNWVVQNAKGNIERVAITGFCWGGRMTWLYAAHNPKIKAGVAWYGKLIGDKNVLNPQQPIDVAASLTVPVLGLYGGQDTGIPLDSVEQTRQQLQKGKSGSSIIVYPDAPHAFFADYRPNYRQKDAQDGWKRLQAWFKAKGVTTESSNKNSTGLGWTQPELSQRETFTGSSPLSPASPAKNHVSENASEQDREFKVGDRVKPADPFHERGQDAGIVESIEGEQFVVQWQKSDRLARRYTREELQMVA